jgi:hypothetical protein
MYQTQEIETYSMIWRLEYSSNNHSSHTHTRRIPVLVGTQAKSLINSKCDIFFYNSKLFSILCTVSYHTKLR